MVQLKSAMSNILPRLFHFSPPNAVQALLAMPKTTMDPRRRSTRAWTRSCRTRRRRSCSRRRSACWRDYERHKAEFHGLANQPW